MSPSSSVRRSRRHRGWPLVAGIRCYRATLGRVPRRAVCLFSTTCSRQVEQIARAHGVRAGLRECRSRLRACRPGYTFEFEGDAWCIVCVDGTTHTAAELSAAVHVEAAGLAHLIHTPHNDRYTEGNHSDGQGKEVPELLDQHVR